MAKKKAKRKSRSAMAKGSIHSVARGKGKKKVKRRRKSGMRKVSILRKNPVETYRVFVQIGSKYGYYTGKGFDSEYSLSKGFSKETATRKARQFAKAHPTRTFGVSHGRA